MDGTIEGDVVAAAIGRAHGLHQNEQKVDELTDEQEPQGTELGKP